MSGLSRGATNICRALLILPMVATPVAMGLVWVIMLDPTAGHRWTPAGRQIGIYPSATVAQRSRRGLGCRTLVAVDALDVDSPDGWRLICIAGLAALPPEPFEAAIGRRRLGAAGASGHLTFPDDAADPDGGGDAAGDGSPEGDRHRLCHDRAAVAGAFVGDDQPL